MQWSAFGLANVLASLLLVTLGLLFLRAPKSEFTVAFAVYSCLAAAQKLTGGMWLYFRTASVPPESWQLVSSLCLLASTPTLAHALAAFTWERTFTRRPTWQKAAIYAPFAAVAPVVLVMGPRAFAAVSFAIAAVFGCLLLVFLVAIARRLRRARSAVAVSQSKHMLAYLVIALSFAVEARVIYLVYGVFPWWELSLAYAVATGILLYSILKAHLFDVDLKVKWTIKQSTIAAAFIAVFFVVSESASAFFEGRVGTYVGIAAAGLLVFAIVPLQRLAERISAVAIPNVADTPDYARYRKFEVYRGAVERALMDGVVSAEERAILAGLRRDLGIGAADADALERDLAGMEGARPASR